MSEEEALAEEGQEEEDTEKDDSGEDKEESPKKRAKKGAAKGKDKDKDGKAKKKKKPAVRKHPKTLEMVVEAIEHMNEKGGSSVQAIKAYILQNFPSVRPDMVKNMLKRAFTQGVAQNVICRPKKQGSTILMAGRYMLGKSVLPEEEEVMPQQSKRARDAQMLKAAKKPGRKGKKKKKAAAGKKRR